MVIYRFEKEFEFTLGTENKKVNSNLLGEALESAEEEAYKRLHEAVSRHFIDFAIDADVKLLQENKGIKLLILLTINLEISPISPKVTEQDLIAREIADAFFETIRKQISKVLGEAYH
ncbi:MAG: hypothetical protein NDP13_02170 [Crenarchaeota archaeon]|nr:hypothetical protein [Thermoproteota archaeon]MCR8453780.1 hypothetical protein [Thermoproteota archaeon]MCR8455140.1 hypothetical protein [Thermoproteota archaeon]MCR8462854.1 hypothetical protein [Thermoproteota archaeon]MCR8470964.1 hypothetical protein [Thermoproteota archaeon]